MNRKVMKIVSILLMVAMVITILSPLGFASSVENDKTDYSNISQFSGQSKDKTTAGVFQSFIATLINVIQVVGMGVAVIMLVVMAIKYISAAPSEKAEIKKSATVYIVGAIVLFAASGILQLVKNFANANINDNVSEATKPGAMLVINTVKAYLG